VTSDRHLKEDRATACLRLLAICFAQSLSKRKSMRMLVLFLSQGECRNILQIGELPTLNML